MGMLALSISLLVGAWAGRISGSLQLIAAETVHPSLRQDATFSTAAPYGSATEMKRHLGFRLEVPEYDLEQERFRVIIPATYSTNETWGLLAWASPSDEPGIPAAWESELASQRLLVVSAYGSGNQRHAIQRGRLLLDAVCNMTRQYKIDPKRIYVGGLSGGGRIASIMGVAYADLFSGTLAICGADFYQSVASINGEVFPATYQPTQAVLARAKANGRFVLLTGEKDPNRDNTKTLADRGFARQGFRFTLYVEVPGMGHTLPSPAVLRQALNFIEKPKPATRSDPTPRP